MKRVLRGARRPRRADVRDPLLREPDPRDQAADVGLLLVEPVELVQHGARDEAEVARVERCVDVGEALEEAVEQLRGGPLEEGLALAPLADSVDHLVARAPRPDHLRHHPERVLEVGVHHHGGVRRYGLQPGRDRQLVSEVARERDDDVARPVGHEVADERGRPVAAPVVYEHDLRDLWVVRPVRLDLVDQEGEHVLFVVERDDEGHRLPARGVCRRTPGPALLRCGRHRGRGRYGVTGHGASSWRAGGRGWDEEPVYGQAK